MLDLLNVMWSVANVFCSCMNATVEFFMPLCNCRLSYIDNATCLWQVFHGAQHDIEWLQRDLCVYVVNMFDTHEAAKLLNFARLSLAFLMNYYCRVMADKRFQLADWRIR